MRAIYMLELTPEEEQFRQEVADFIDAELTSDLKLAASKQTTVFPEKDVALKWQAILHKRGWAAPAWPKEFGGPGWTLTQQFLFGEECAKAGAPGLIPLGMRMLAPVLFKYGSKEQQEYYLPKILSGEHYWCQGYSEPGSGSDLASLKTQAVRDGDEYVVNGTKIWTTHAQFADHIFCLVRTQADGKPQTSISFLLIEMDRPGITVEPIITMAHDHEVNQVFFDNVRVPVSNRVGPENEGWTAAKYLLEFERGGGGGAVRMQLGMKSLMDLLEQYGDPAGDIAKRAAELQVSVDAFEYMEGQVQAKVAKGGNPGPESSLMKNFSTTIGQQMSTLRLEIVEYYGIPNNNLLMLNNDKGVGPDNVHTTVGTYLNGRASTIFGGSEQVQKNIIAKVVLGL